MVHAVLIEATSIAIAVAIISGIASPLRFVTLPQIAVSARNASGPRIPFQVRPSSSWGRAAGVVGRFGGRSLMASESRRTYLPEAGASIRIPLQLGAVTLPAYLPAPCTRA